MNQTIRTLLTFLNQNALRIHLRLQIKQQPLYTQKIPIEIKKGYTCKEEYEGHTIYDLRIVFYICCGHWYLLTQRRDPFRHVGFCSHPTFKRLFLRKFARDSVPVLSSVRCKAAQEKKNRFCSLFGIGCLRKKSTFMITVFLNNYIQTFSYDANTQNLTYNYTIIICTNLNTNSCSSLYIQISETTFSKFIIKVKHSLE